MADKTLILTPGKPLTAFCQEVKIGDLKKYQNQSNNSPTGGGARDLRISPAKIFWDEMKPFFPTEISVRSRTGVLLSEGSSNTHSAEINLMGPTAARRNELRICEISKINGWRITKSEYDVKISKGYKWFFLLIIDDKNQVWASKFCSDVLDRMDEKIKLPLLADIKKYHDKSKTIRRIIKFRNGK